MPHHEAVEFTPKDKPVTKSYTATYLEDDIVFIFIKGDQKGANFKFEVSEEIPEEEEPEPEVTIPNTE